MEAKVAVLGDNDFVMPFSTMGLDTYGVEEKQSAVAEAAKTIVEKRYGLVVVAENVAPMAEEIFSELDSKPLPAVVIVPFTADSEGFALESLGKVLKMAIGIDIVSQ